LLWVSSDRDSHSYYQKKIMTGRQDDALATMGKEKIFEEGWA
jgi:hypothetical protein